MINTVSEKAIIESVEDSRMTAKREVETRVDWNEKGDMLKELLRKLLNKEISVDEYKAISEDIKDTF